MSGLSFEPKHENPRVRTAGETILEAWSALGNALSSWALGVAEHPFWGAVASSFRGVASGAGRLAASFGNAIDRVVPRSPLLARAAALLKHASLRMRAQALATYRQRAWVRTGLGSSTLLALVFAIDGSTRFQQGSKILYVLPIWLATRLGGPAAGGVAVVLTTVLLGALDAALGLAPPGMVTTNMALRMLSFTVVMVIIAQFECRFREARAMATYDTLTGVLNRASFEAQAEESVVSAIAKDRLLAVGLVDCDRFKELNDTYGHAFGDHALRVVARRLQAASKPSGLVGRFGGDEFVVVFEGLRPQGVRDELSRAKCTFGRHMESLGCPAAISCGFAILGPDGTTLEALLRRADERMYADKRSLLAVVEMADEVDLGVDGSLERGSRAS